MRERERERERVRERERERKWAVKMREIKKGRYRQEITETKRIYRY